jgi:hypothetical protein
VANPWLARNGYSQLRFSLAALLRVPPLSVPSVTRIDVLRGAVYKRQFRIELVEALKLAGWSRFEDPIFRPSPFQEDLAELL